jgi:tetratricopeptide (TPR) repeat protein
MDDEIIDEINEARMRKDYPKAIELARNALASEGNDVFLMIQLSGLLVLENQIDEAVAIAKDALAIASSDEDKALCYSNIGSAMMRKDAWSEAAEAYQQAVALASEPWLWCSLGVALESSNDLEGARDAYVEGLRLDPKDAELIAGLARVKLVLKMN